jgi:hypothetical protein
MPTNIHLPERLENTNIQKNKEFELLSTDMDIYVMKIKIIFAFKFAKQFLFWFHISIHQLVARASAWVND